MILCIQQVTDPQDKNLYTRTMWSEYKTYEYKNSVHRILQIIEIKV